MPRPAGKRTRHHGDDRHDHETSDQREHPSGLGVAAGAQPVEQRERPACIGGPMGRSPRAIAEAAPHQAGDRDRQQQVECDGSEPDPQWPVGRRERVTASIRRTGANPSSSEVTMWTSRNAIASSETLRCTASSTNRGMFGDCSRRTFAIPSATLSVSRTSAIVPVPRVKYQYALGPMAAVRFMAAPLLRAARDDRAGTGGRRRRGGLGGLLNATAAARARGGRRREAAG